MQYDKLSILELYRGPHIDSPVRNRIDDSRYRGISINEASTRTSLHSSILPRPPRFRRSDFRERAERLIASHLIFRVYT
jgi:hypothetical protein